MLNRRSAVARVIFLGVACLSPTMTPLSLAQGPAGGKPEKRIALKAGAYDPLRELPPIPERLRRGPYEPGQIGTYLVQLDGDPSPALRSAIEDLGGRFLDYIPKDAFVLRLPSGVESEAVSLPGVRFLGPVHPGLKLSPDLGTRPFADQSRRATADLDVVVELFPGGDDVQSVTKAIAERGGVVLATASEPVPRLRVRATRLQLEVIARIADVAFIEEVGEIVYRNDTTRWVIQSNQLDLTSIWDHGLRGEGQIGGIIDGPMDMNSCYFSESGSNSPGPGHRKVVAYRSSSGQGANSHGTHVAGTFAGDQEPVNGTNSGNGIAYKSKISFGNSNDITGLGGGPSNLYDALRDAHLDGARAHGNSWGDDGTTSYTALCVDIDRFSYDFEESVVLFAETNTSTLRTPENAKNVVAVGASSNGTAAGSFCSGGRGPTSDGRRKPEVFAPGCSIISAQNNSACGTRSFSGTSMASPAVTGAALLVRQYFADGFYPTGSANPADALVASGALMRAMLINGSVDMTGIAGPPPNDSEGWGRLLLEDALFFAGETRRLLVLADVRNANGLANGQQLPHMMTVVSSGEPLKITLAFTEPAGSLLASDPVVNDLDLIVEAPDGTYLGNVFDAAGASITGGSGDRRNNVEQVVIPSPATGSYTVRVVGASVNQGLQGYALIATGDVVEVLGPFLSHEASTFSDQPPFGNGNGVLDPGESATLFVELKNSGTEAATGVSARLSSDRPEIVKVTGAVAGFPDIGAGASAPSHPPHYAMTVEPAAVCGATVRLTLSTAAEAFSGETSWTVGIGRDGGSYAGPAQALSKRGTVTSAVDVLDSFTVADVLLGIDLTHGDVGELIVDLVSPQDTTVTLHNGSGAGSANLVGTYDSTLIPDGPGSLSDFNGEAAQGIWTLRVEDTAGGPLAAGALNGWTLQLTAKNPFACDPLTCGEPIPASVGNSVIVEPQGATNLRLAWQAVPGASAYRVWSSDRPTFEGEQLVGETVATELVIPNTADALPVRHYRVRATNGCHWEGP